MSQYSNTSYQFMVTTELPIAPHGANEFMLTYKAAIPMNFNVNAFTLSLDIHDYSFNEMTDDGLPVSSSRASSVPKSR